MKKIITVILCIMFVFSLVGCGKEVQSISCPIEEIAMEAIGEDNDIIVGHDICPAIMVNNVVYYDTGRKSNADRRCGVMDGKITTECSSSEIPTNNNQGNFGTDYSYQYGGAEGTIEVLLNDGNWYIFATEEVKNTGFNN